MLANIHRQYAKVEQYEKNLSALVNGEGPSKYFRRKKFLEGQEECRQVIKNNWDEILKSYYSIQQVSTRFNFSFRLVKSILTETQKQQLRIKFEKKLIDLFSCGHSIIDIADFFKISVSLIRQEIMKLKKG
jgi:hypothetical protein